MLSVGFDLSGCNQITDFGLEHLNRLRDLRVLNLDGCVFLTDKGIKKLKPLAEKLEALSLAGLVQLTNAGLLEFVQSCQYLKLFNINNCGNITYELVYIVANTNTRLATLNISSTQISDDGLSQLATVVSKKHLTSLDLSFCRDITDFGIICLSESCPNLRRLNLCGLSRITGEGLRHICSKCWYLEDLALEDLFLLDDDVFWFSSSFDGRPAADENMLKSLVALNLRDCSNITNSSIHGMAERCRRVERFVLRGCDKLSDDIVDILAEPYGDPKNIPMCDSFKLLDVSFCSKLTAPGILRLLPICGLLEELNMSGITSVDDNFIRQMCIVCPTIQKLEVQKCVQITDAALCSISDYLWLEALDVTGCHKITDDGIEVLTIACNGIRTLTLKRLSKLTSRSVNAMARNCKVLRHVDVQNCHHITQLSIDDLKTRHPTVKVFSTPQ